MILFEFENTPRTGPRLVVIICVLHGPRYPRKNVCKDSRLLTSIVRHDGILPTTIAWNEDKLPNNIVRSYVKLPKPILGMTLD